MFVLIPAIVDHPAGTVLLETSMRDGEISYQPTDIVQREGEWQPPDRYKADLKKHHGSTPEAKVKFVSEGNGAISYSCVVVTVEKPCRQCSACMTRCWAGFTSCMSATWARICDCAGRRCKC